MVLALVGCGSPGVSSPPDEPSIDQTSAATTPVSVLDSEVAPPDHAVRLVFIHHSSGENWLGDESGGLGIALAANNYFVSDTNYGWGPEDSLLGGAIGDYTDIGHWWNWFEGPSSDTIMGAVYTESGQNSWYSRLDEDPGGENQIVMFKSCFPNSNMGGSPNDPPTTGSNPLTGAGLDNLTVGNAKALYRDLLDYFAEHQDKLFVVITAPPLLDSDTSPEAATNVRAFNRWLVEDWLDDYPHANVAVFDFYNVLTSNGGGPDSNDLGAEAGNHHRYRGGQIEYVTDQGSNTSAYAIDGDSHPTYEGNAKATGEYIPMLNYFYERWQDGS
jgi:hypothetical protein